MKAPLGVGSPWELVTWWFYIGLTKFLSWTHNSEHLLEPSPKRGALYQLSSLSHGWYKPRTRWDALTKCRPFTVDLLLCRNFARYSQKFHHIGWPDIMAKFWETLSEFCLCKSGPVIMAKFRATSVILVGVPIWNLRSTLLMTLSMHCIHHGHYMTSFLFACILFQEFAKFNITVQESTDSTNGFWKEENFAFESQAP